MTIILRNLEGQRFGRYVAKSVMVKLTPAGRSVRYWKCQCVCGVNKDVREDALLSGNTKSCGCYRSDNTRLIKHKHGKCYSSVYRVHRQMMARCYNPNTDCYSDYGGRGISVASEWHDFEQFYLDMGDRPRGMTLDRRDNSLGYSKANCQWATHKEQNNNRRSNRFITFDGITLNQKQWAERVGISDQIICERLKNGWSIEDALTRKIRKVTRRSRVITA